MASRLALNYLIFTLFISSSNHCGISPKRHFRRKNTHSATQQLQSSPPNQPEGPSLEQKCPMFELYQQCAKSKINKKRKNTRNYGEKKGAKNHGLEELLSLKKEAQPEKQQTKAPELINEETFEKEIRTKITQKDADEFDLKTLQNRRHDHLFVALSFTNREKTRKESYIENLRERLHEIEDNYQDPFENATSQEIVDALKKQEKNSPTQDIWKKELQLFFDQDLESAIMYDDIQKDLGICYEKKISPKLKNNEPIEDVMLEISSTITQDSANEIFNIKEQSCASPNKRFNITELIKEAKKNANNNELKSINKSSEKINALLTEINKYNLATKNKKKCEKSLKEIVINILFLIKNIYEHNDWTGNYLENPNDYKKKLDTFEKKVIYAALIETTKKHHFLSLILTKGLYRKYCDDGGWYNEKNLDKTISEVARFWSVITNNNCVQTRNLDIVFLNKFINDNEPFKIFLLETIHLCLDQIYKKDINRPVPVKIDVKLKKLTKLMTDIHGALKAKWIEK